MTDFIIVAIILVLVGYGAFSTMKHFKKKGGCCSSGDYKPRKKKLNHVLYKKIFHVEGMHCEHCKARVEECVNDIMSVAGSVNLKTSELTVSYAEEVEDELIQARIERAGYTVTSINNI